MAQTLIFPADLGEGSYIRKTTSLSAGQQAFRTEQQAFRTDQQNINTRIGLSNLASATQQTYQPDFYFINFAAYKISDATSYTPSSSNSDIYDRNGNLLSGINVSRNLTNTGAGSPLGTSRTNLYSKEAETNIIMYMPEEVKVNYSADLTTFDEGLLANYLNKALDGGLEKSAQYLEQNISPIAKSALLGITGAASTTEIFNLIQARKGKSFNPVTEQLFKNMKLRNFNYSFKLVPRNERESRIILEIIKQFKYHMHPEYMTDRLEFKYPSLFVISYHRNNSPSEYKAYEQLHLISSCYLEDMNVNYTGTGQFSTFKDGQPVQIILDLKFRETVIQTKENIQAGY